MNISDLRKKLNVMKSLNTAPEAEQAPDTSIIEYKKPSLSLLKSYRSIPDVQAIEAIELEEKLSDFGFETSVEGIKTGPMITQYELKLARGVRLSQVRNLSEDISLAMGGNIRIEAPIPGTSNIGIQISNESQSIVGLKQVIKSSNKGMELPIALGCGITGDPKIVDLAKMPHLLVAGQTGSGKSVFINSIILSLIYNKTPEECQLILIDPKRVEMASYKDVPHLKKLVTDPEDALEVFNSLVEEMENRYEILEDAKVRNIKSYNETHDKRMPYISVVVDEMSDLMMTSGKALEAQIVRLAQLARAVGIHLVLATQKPIVKVITGLIKSNMPSRVSFKVSTKSDSRVILDCNGAEQLIGRGDMLFIGPGCPEPERFHGAWVSDNEIQKVTEAIREE